MDGQENRRRAEGEESVVFGIPNGSAILFRSVYTNNLPPPAWGTVNLVIRYTKARSSHGSSKTMPFTFSSSSSSSSSQNCLSSSSDVDTRPCSSVIHSHC